MGCASQTMPPAIHSTPLSAFAALAEDGDAAPDVDVLAVPPAAARWLETEFELDAEPTIETVRRLAAAFDKDGSLALRYEPLGATTATETFERRAGNCLAYAHLFIALARALGVDAGYREVLQAPEWQRHGGVAVRSHHIGAHGDIQRYGTFHADFAGQAASGIGWGRRISDDRARAQHFNNLGAIAFIEGDVDLAIRRYRRALRLEPSLPYVWSNLGLAHSRQDDLPKAEWALREAVRLDAHHYPALEGLRDYYERAGHPALAAAYRQRAADAQWQNPFARYDAGVAALNAGEYAKAIVHLESATESLSDQVIVFIHLGRAYFLAERLRKSRQALTRAGELANTREDRNLVAKTIKELEAVKAAFGD